MAVLVHAETPSSAHPHGYKIMSKTPVYKGWRTIVQQETQMRNGKTATFDIVGQASSKGAVTVFCWDTHTKTATLIREYHPGPHCMLIGCAAGMIESDKHENDALVAARLELQEECHLEGGTWIPLVSQGISMDKYHSTTMHAYLVLDPTKMKHPPSLDDEEDIEIVGNVTCEEILQMLKSGKMNVVGSWVCLLAMEKLREMGEI